MHTTTFSSTNKLSDHIDSTNFKSSEPHYNNILYKHAIEKYIEPLLRRHWPPISNPVILIPERVKRRALPRPAQEQLQMSNQGAGLRNMREHSSMRKEGQRVRVNTNE
ncbi:hypothetical protein BKA66DRAFT_239300 [Pyrenochaeta sp. MPI-SDFR-AT-0127]|nr:hypothetical protein BKA66DRAFT_239300 [Pyrenochaeta sp. MPI-SDFR-AT-0127]